MQIHEIKNMQMLKEIQGHFDERIIVALRKTNRENFVPHAMKHSAFKPNALPMNAEQWISSPFTVAKMTSYIMAYDLGDFVCPAHSILEVGLGSGYQAVVLSHLIRRVFSIERIESLWLEARNRIAKLKIMNINIRLDDGMNGWEAFAPYDRILLSACATSITQALFDQLSDGGVMVAPVYNGSKQSIMRFVKRQNALVKSEILESCEFVPIVAGVKRDG